MTEIEIPFKDRFTMPMQLGVKTRTWRTRRYGEVGDTFRNGLCLFKITSVERAGMGSVPAYYQAEGFNDEQDAIQMLKEIFPANGYQPDRMGWAHWFEKVNDR
jgi:hypothetical protein